MDDTRDGSKKSGRASENLERIAELLDCPIEAFASGSSAPLDVSGVSELLSLWVSIDDDADRAKLLDLARELAKL